MEVPSCVFENLSHCLLQKKKCTESRGNQTGNREQLAGRRETGKTRAVSKGFAEWSGNKVSICRECALVVRLGQTSHTFDFIGNRRWPCAETKIGILERLLELPFPAQVNFSKKALNQTCLQGTTRPPWVSIMWICRTCLQATLVFRELFVSSYPGKLENCLTIFSVCVQFPLFGFECRLAPQLPEWSCLTWKIQVEEKAVQMSILFDVVSCKKVHLQSLLSRDAWDAGPDSVFIEVCERGIWTELHLQTPCIDWVSAYEFWTSNNTKGIISQLLVKQTADRLFNFSVSRTSGKDSREPKTASVCLICSWSPLTAQSHFPSEGLKSGKV